MRVQPLIADDPLVWPVRFMVGRTRAIVAQYGRPRDDAPSLRVTYDAPSWTLHENGIYAAAYVSTRFPHELACKAFEHLGVLQAEVVASDAQASLKLMRAHLDGAFPGHRDLTEAELALAQDWLNAHAYSIELTVPIPPVTAWPELW